MRIRVNIEPQEGTALAIRRESVLPVPADGRLTIELPVAHTALLQRLTGAVDDLVEAYAEQRDIRDNMIRLDAILSDCRQALKHKSEPSITEA